MTNAERNGVSREVKINAYFHEYEKLKDEQTARIGFRDNLIYVSLGVFGGLLSFSLADTTHQYALLIVPWVSVVLGWTYLINDEKISSIGAYIRDDLCRRVQGELELTPPHANLVFAWEIYHRRDKHRVRRKIQQLVVDQIAFVGPGIASLSAVMLIGPKLTLLLLSIVVVDAVFLLWIAAEIFVYSDFRREPLNQVNSSVETERNN